ncbi:MAG: hypothetical protein P4L69_13685, partial [Desulfosporosinus sp.]|nr:hypothetical protein [Desulfosporosinus sp.]
MRKTKTIAIATAITTLLSASAVFADTLSTNLVTAPSSTQTHMRGVNNMFKNHLDSLLTAGTINQAQEDAIQAAISAIKGQVSKTSNDGFKNHLAALVTAGTITQAQADAITTAMSTATKTAGGVKTAIDALVTAGTITQAQEDAIMPQKGNFMRGAQDGAKNHLAALVTAGTITQAQADAITTAMSTATKTAGGVKTAIDALVTANTITQAQEDAIMPQKGNFMR